jgi:hypothetical protein
MPDAPDGEHSTQAGTLIEGTVVALPEDPAAAAGAGEVEGAVLIVLGSAVEAPAVDVVVPVDTAPVDAEPEGPVVAAGAAGAAAAGLAVAVEAVGLGVPMARLTTPLTVTVPGVVAVCAAAGNATPSDNSTA